MRRPILHVIPHLWSGAGAVLTRLCESQRERGPVAIVTSGTRDAQPDWAAYRARLRRAGVTHHTIDLYRRDAATFWSSAAALADLLRTLKPAVIHAHAGVPCAAAVIARRLGGRRIPIIGQMYSWGPDRPDWMNQQDLWGFSAADRVVCSAYAYRDLLLRGGVARRSLVYLPWGLALDALPWRGTAGQFPPPDGAAPVVGFVGRIEPRKNQLALVEAFASLRRGLPRARLELVGPIADEPYAKRVRDTIAAHHLLDAVTMTGEVRDVVSHVRQWHLFVSLSSDEGQGLAVLEAMATGVPVIARPVAGLSDYLVDGRTGLTIDGASTRATVAALRRAWTSPALLARVSRQARLMVERRYNWIDTVKAFDRLYASSPVALAS